MTTKSLQFLEIREVQLPTAILTTDLPKVSKRFQSESSGSHLLETQKTAHYLSDDALTTKTSHTLSQISQSSHIVTKHIANALNTINATYTLERNDYIYVNYISTLSSVSYFFTFPFITAAAVESHSQIWKFGVYLAAEMLLESVAMVVDLWMNDVAIGDFPQLSFKDIAIQSFIMAEYAMCFTAAVYNIFGYG
ncbi:hypothetical protein HDU97_005317 [Phlyctochytrium planicorne]|nr:hypothetical protein HDU97_005317 [Phlyctochytrium planicorne]